MSLLHEEFRVLVAELDEEIDTGAHGSIAFSLENLGITADDCNAHGIGHECQCVQCRTGAVSDMGLGARGGSICCCCVARPISVSGTRGC